MRQLKLLPPAFAALDQLDARDGRPFRPHTAVCGHCANLATVWPDATACMTVVGGVRCPGNTIARVDGWNPAGVR